MNPEMRATILDLLATHNNMTIATVREDGYPQATTVGYVNDGLEIYFGCWTKSQKAHNLASNAKVSIAIDRDYEDWDKIKGLSLGGTARQVTEPSEIERVVKLFLRKFPQLAKFSAAEAPDTVFFHVTPSVISVLDYAKGFGHTDLVTL